MTMIFKMSRPENVLIIVLSLLTAECYAAAVTDNKVESRALTVQNETRAPSESLLTEKVTPVRKATMELHAEQWEMARSGDSLLRLPVLNKVVTAWLDDRHKVIEIQYPGGEEGEFWVQELTDWLVSLGIPSRSMITTPGSGSDDKIRFNIIK